MLDGKFSVYNSSGGAAPASTANQKPSPINFKFESIQSAQLSFDDEMRQSLEQFYKAREPSPVSVALKKWVSEGSSKLLSLIGADKPKSTSMKVEAKPEKKEEPVISFLSSMFKGVKIPSIPVPKISLPTIQFPKISLPTISFPKISLPTLELPKINIPIAKIVEPFQKIVDKLEQLAHRILERARELYEKTKEKAEKFTEYLWDKIPHERIAEITAFVLEIPQQLIIPAALWVASFIPTETIKSSFQSGVERITRWTSYAFGFAQKGYSFCEDKVKKFASYINRKYILPLAQFLESLFRMFLQFLLDFYNWILPFIKGTGKALYHIVYHSPRYTMNFLKLSWRGLKRLTIWLVE